MLTASFGSRRLVQARRNIRTLRGTMWLLPLISCTSSSSIRRQRPQRYVISFGVICRGRNNREPYVRPHSELDRSKRLHVQKCGRARGTQDERLVSVVDGDVESGRSWECTDDDQHETVELMRRLSNRSLNASVVEM